MILFVIFIVSNGDLLTPLPSVTLNCLFYLGLQTQYHKVRTTLLSLHPPPTCVMSFMTSTLCVSLTLSESSHVIVQTNPLMWSDGKWALHFRIKWPMQPGANLNELSTHYKICQLTIIDIGIKFEKFPQKFASNYFLSSYFLQRA